MLLFSVFSQLRSDYRICFLWSTSFNRFNCLYSPPNSECWMVPLVERTKTADGARLICACSWLLKQLGYLIPNGGFVYCKVSNCCMLFYWFLRQSGSQQNSQAPSEICFMRNAKIHLCFIQCYAVNLAARVDGSSGRKVLSCVFMW